MPELPLEAVVPKVARSSFIAFRSGCPRYVVASVSAYTSAVDSARHVTTRLVGPPRTSGRFTPMPPFVTEASQDQPWSRQANVSEIPPICRCRRSTWSAPTVAISTLTPPLVVVAMRPPVSASALITSYVQFILCKIMRARSHISDTP